MRILLVLLTLVACGTKEGSDSEPATQFGWTEENLAVTKVNCVNGLMADGYSAVGSDIYCQCIIYESVSLRYTYQDFQAREDAIAQELVDDGSIEFCVDKAKNR